MQSNNYRILFYLSWLILHLFQGATTELFDDEAYYWVYSLFPSWGYFDHPPVIAILIKAGCLISHSEFGVRLFPAILSTLAIYLTETLLVKKNPYLFYAICGSLALAQIGGMLAVPDTVLMFFVVLFFWLYKRFIERTNYTNAILLGICMALLVYTKYHGILVIIFTGLSNIKLLRKPQTYVAIFIAVLLFLPHLYWQHINGYPSVQFHLFERNSETYSVKNTIEFILGQVVLAGPLMGWLLIIASLLYKPLTQTEKAFKYTLVGFYLFFLLSTLKGRAEANWTVPAFIGLIVLSHQYLIDHAKWRKWLYYSLPLTLILVFTARILMIIDMPPKWWLAKDEFHQNKIWVNDIKRKAGGLPVVFLDSYQKPSKYWFYGHDTAFGLNTSRYRRNNYNFWNVEDSIISRPAYIAGYRRVDNYYSFSKVMIDNTKICQIKGKEVSIRFRTVSPVHYLEYFKKDTYGNTPIYLTIYKNKTPYKDFSSSIILKDITRPVQENIVTFTLDSLNTGNYAAKFSIGTCVPRRLTMNSSEFHISIQ
ncbi:MAG: glycosyltransferase family 39 protein [Chitinophagaceae bacterium]|nr:glycosyltransferase family 39 protein [Chitinophagaceae bacterium]